MNQILESNKQLQENAECPHYYIRKRQKQVSANCCPCSFFCNFPTGIPHFLFCQVHYFCNSKSHFKYQLTSLTENYRFKKIQACPQWYLKAWSIMLFSPPLSPLSSFLVLPRVTFELDLLWQDFNFTSSPKKPMRHL